MSELKDWVSGEKDMDKSMIKWAEENAKELSIAATDRKGRPIRDSALTPSTIRRFFGEMRRIQARHQFDLSDAQMLQAKLAYDAGRKGHKVKTFYKLMTPGIQVIDDKKSFDRFVKIAEAIVSFHKLHYVGKDD